VLVHAEIEIFCEELALERVQIAKNQFLLTSKLTPVLRKIVTYYVGKHRDSWKGTLNPSPDLIESAFNSYKGDVDTNHGVKEKNIKVLFHPLGMMNIDATWLAAMNAFGSTRGEFAHRGIKAHSQPDAQTELQRVEKVLLPGLLGIDRKMKSLK
jgi:hypothetical protein